MCWPRSSRLEGAYTETLTNHEVEIFHERAALTGPNAVQLASGKTVTADKILIATGARPLMPEIEGIEHAISSNEVFHLDKLPEADRDRRRRLYRQRIRRHLPPVRKPGDAGQPQRRRCCAATTSRFVDRLLQISLSQGHRFQVQRDLRADRASATTARCKLTMTGCDDIEADAGAVRGRPPAQCRGPGLRGGRRRRSASKGEIKVDDDNRTSVAVDLRGRRRHRPRPADPGRDPRGPGLRRHRLRQQADAGRLRLHPERGVQPSAARRGRHDRGRGAQHGWARSRPTPPTSGR